MPKVFSAVVRAVYAIAILAACHWVLFAGPISIPAPTAASAPAPRAPDVERTRQLVERARELMNAERYADALGPMRALHETDPGSHIYIRELATIYKHLGRLKDETQMWEAFVRHSPTPSEACPRIGEVYREQGMEKESLDAYKRCYAFDEGDPDGTFYLARAYEWEQRYDEAQQLYERGAQLDAKYLDMQLGLARLKLHRGHPAEAREAALRVLNQSPKDVDAMLIIGLSYQRDGNRREARQYLEQGVKLADQYADFHLALGMLDEEEQHVQQAMNHYNRSISLSPDYHDAVVRRDRLAQRMKQ